MPFGFGTILLQAHSCLHVLPPPSLEIDDEKGIPDPDATKVHANYDLGTFFGLTFRVVMTGMTPFTRMPAKNQVPQP